ncbi:(p)ppGpp synthase/HD superfamily hydrolase [Natronobacillus azotifigens]|uniref:HD domain-containing protein n=1 Tax=Natronobacillus azotifigens TaxID=472978 RepID=A0A9J6RAW2_9BACI|nr:HD domain-containing protein [Natronobacillus azotifigens]MCZ0702701.1 HD domain-containing protein [Natronobacillus azotifigens]
MITGNLMRAITYATNKHDGQKRKVDKTPYIAHPYRVAMLLKEYQCSEHVVIAGLLHDIVEDTDGTIGGITNLFGKEVRDLIEFVTELDKKTDWEERKEHSIEKIKNAPMDAKLVTCADKIDNLQSMLDSEMIYGNSMWRSFERGKKDQQWYYQKMYESVVYQIPHHELHPLMHLYEKLLQQFMEERI